MFSGLLIFEIVGGAVFFLSFFFRILTVRLYIGTVKDLQQQSQYSLLHVAEISVSVLGFWLDCKIFYLKCQGQSVASHIRCIKLFIWMHNKMCSLKQFGGILNRSINLYFKYRGLPFRHLNCPGNCCSDINSLNSGIQLLTRFIELIKA